MGDIPSNGKSATDEIFTKPRIPAEEPPSPSAGSRLDIALAITGKFEGKGFGQVTGNFDGMAVSCGILQWNYGMESLQGKILRPYIAKHGSIDALGIFPFPVDKTAQMGASAAIAHAKAHMLSGTALTAPAKAAWEKFMLLPEVVAIQKANCQDLGDRAEKMMVGLGFKAPISARAYAWGFDTLTLNGSMKETKFMFPDRAAAKRELAAVTVTGHDSASLTKNQSVWPVMIDLVSDEQVSLLRMAIHRAKQSRAEFVNVVITRRGTISIGEGFVYGERLSLKKFDPSLAPFKEAA